MKFEKDKLYKVVEIRGAMVIMDNINDRLKGQKAQPLIIGSGQWVCAYLMAYFAHRENGLDLCRAHDAALASEGIPKASKNELNENTFLDPEAPTPKLNG